MGRGGQILARTLILFKGEIDMTMASTDLAWVEVSTMLPVRNGGKVTGLSREILTRCWGRGGGEIMSLEDCMKSGRGRVVWFREKGNGDFGPLSLRVGVDRPLSIRRRLLISAFEGITEPSKRLS